MPHKIERLCSVGAPITVTSTAANNTRIPYGAAGGGMIFVDSLSGGGNVLTWYAAYSQESPLFEATQVLPDGSTGAVTSDIDIGNALPVPEALFGAPFIVAATNTGTATIRISVKG